MEEEKDRESVIGYCVGCDDEFLIDDDYVIGEFVGCGIDDEYWEGKNLFCSLCFERVDDWFRKQNLKNKDEILKEASK